MQTDTSNTDSSLESFVTSECQMIESDISVFRFWEDGNTLRLLFDGGISYQHEYDKSTGMFNSVDADGELYTAEQENYAALAESTGQRCEWLVDQYLK